jgi:hypothetical protein
MIPRSNASTRPLVTILGKLTQPFLLFHSNINQYHANVHTGPHMSDRKIDTLHSCAHTHPIFSMSEAKTATVNSQAHTHTRARMVSASYQLSSSRLFFSAAYITPTKKQYSCSKLNSHYHHRQRTGTVAYVQIFRTVGVSIWPPVQVRICTRVREKKNAYPHSLKRIERQLRTKNRNICHAMR